MLPLFFKRTFLTVFILVLFFNTVYSQRSVSGTITAAENGAPLAGVNIVITGSDIGTVSDIKGNFNIQIPENDTILVFSFIGFETKEVEVGNSSIIDI